MDEIEIVERGLSKIEDSATKDAAIQTKAEEKETENKTDKGIYRYNWFALIIYVHPIKQHQIFQL